MKARVHTAIQKSENAVNWRAEGRTNVIGALLNGLLLTTALFSFNVDSNTFFAWMTQDLLPKVSKNSVIVMNNASFHKREVF